MLSDEYNTVMYLYKWYQDKRNLLPLLFS